MVSDSSVFCRDIFILFPAIDSGFSSCELPDIGIKAAERFLYFQECLSVPYSCIDFLAIAYNAGIGKQCLPFVISISGNFISVEIVKGLAKIVPLFQNGGPAQSCLKTIQHDEFKQGSVIMNRYTPFFIVIRKTDPTTGLLQVQRVFISCPLSGFA